MMLKSLVVADPVGNVAELVTTQCRRLAEKRVAATTGEQALSLVEQLRPEVAVVSLEITKPSVDKLVPRLIKALPDVLIIATFRELTVPQMEQLNRLGVDDFVAHPINATEIFRAVSRRFHMPFRQHQRYDVAVEVQRADGAPLGRTINISEGGVGLELSVPVQADESVLAILKLPSGPLRSRVRILHVSGEPPAPRVARGQFDMLRGEELRHLVDFIATLENHATSAVHP